MSKYFKKRNTNYSLSLRSHKSSTDSLVSIISIETTKNSIAEENNSFINDEENENQNSNENVDLVSNQFSEATENEAPVQLSSDTSSDNKTNNSVISNRRNSIERIKEGIYQRLRPRHQQSTQTKESYKSSLKNKDKYKMHSSSSLSQKTTCSNESDKLSNTEGLKLNSNENVNLSPTQFSEAMENEATVQLFSDTPSDSKTNSAVTSDKRNSEKRENAKEGIYQRLRPRRQQSQTKEPYNSSLKYKGKNTVHSSSNLSQKMTSFNTDTSDVEKNLISSSKEHLLVSSSNESDKLRNKRKKINKRIDEWNLSESSEESFVYNSSLTASTRKAENRKYALKDFNEMTEIPVPEVPAFMKSAVTKKKKQEKEGTEEKSTINAICRNLQKSMQFHRKKFEKQLKHGKKQFDIETEKMDMVMRGNADDNYESLYLSDTEKKKLLTSSSGTLPDLEIEYKSSPTIDLLETLSTTDSKAASEIILEHYHSVPSIPELQKLSDDEDDRNLPVPLPEVFDERAVSKDVPGDGSEILKKIADELLHSDANLMRELLNEINQCQPIETPLNELCSILNELNCILSNYFENA